MRDRERCNGLAWVTAMFLRAQEFVPLRSRQTALISGKFLAQKTPLKRGVRAKIRINQLAKDMLP